MATSEELYGKVERVNELLQSQEPDNISVDDYGGYTGYKPQSIIDAMNRVFGLGAWGFRPISNEIMKDDKGGGLAVAKVQVFITGVAWEPEAWGQNRVTKGDQGDARKGADTDAWKKGLSFFSIGNRAYHGLLPDKKEQAEQRRQEAAAQRQNGQNSNGRQPAEQKPAQRQQPVANPTPQPQQVSRPAPAKSAEQQPAQGSTPIVPTAAVLEYTANRHLGEGAFAKICAQMQAINKDPSVNLTDPSQWQEKHRKHAKIMIDRAIDEAENKQPVAKAS